MAARQRNSSPTEAPTLGAFGGHAGRARDHLRGDRPAAAVAILFRYSLNTIDPAIMLEAFTLENYIKFFTDPYYLGVL